MKEKSVIAVILALLCICSSLGYGDERIDKARRSLLTRYAQLSALLKHPDVLHSLDIIDQHISDVSNKKVETWIEKISGYSHEQLSNPESFINGDELKLATEYHLFSTEWYYVRFITLFKAGQDGRDVDPKLSTQTCKGLSSEAYKLFEDHGKKYSEFFKMLSQIERQDIMRQIKFSGDSLPNDETRLEQEKSPILQDIHESEFTSEFDSWLKNYGDTSIKVSDEPGTSGMVSKKAHDETKKAQAHETLRYISNGREYMETGFYREKQRQSSDEEKDQYNYDSHTADPRREDLSMLRSMEANQHLTIAVPVDLDLRLSANLDETETGFPYDDMTRKRPKLDLTLAPPVTEGDLYQVDANPELHNKQLKDAIEMDSVPPKRLKCTGSEENNSPRCHNLDGVPQSSPAQFTSVSGKILENLSASSNVQIIHFL